MVINDNANVSQYRNIETMLSSDESGTIDSILVTVIENAKAQLASISTGVQLALAELRVIVSHAGLIVCLMIVAAGMLIVGWGLLLVLGVLLFLKLGLSNVLAVLCVFIVNAIALGGVVIVIRNTLEHLSFKHTRQALSTNVSEFGVGG